VLATSKGCSTVRSRALIGVRQGQAGRACARLLHPEEFELGGYDRGHLEPRAGAQKEGDYVVASAVANGLM
jgi:hypothetical protein